MKIAITSQGNSLDSLVDQRFGRCAYFAFYDTESKELEFVENAGKNAEEGAGPTAVAFVANKGVHKIVAGEFGFKIKDMLKELNIQMIIMKEDKTIREVVDLLTK